MGLGVGIGLMLVWSAFFLPRSPSAPARTTGRATELLARAGLGQVPVPTFVALCVVCGVVTTLVLQVVSRTPPVAVAFGLMGAWALSTCSTPVGAVVLSIARLADVPMRVVARQWNGRFVILGALVLAAWLVLLSQLP